LILGDITTPTKRINFDISNQFENLNYAFKFPFQNMNQSTGSSEIATTNATQKLSNKELNRPVVVDDVDDDRKVTLDLSNITEQRIIKFPDSDATLLSTQNVTLDDVNFGAGIGAQRLTAKVRQQQLYLSQI